MSDSNRVELSIHSSTKCLPIVRGAVERMAGLEGFDETDAHALTWAIDEALSNVIKHGYEGMPDQPISICLARVTSPDGRSGIAVTVRDQGRQVDPATIRSRDLGEVRPGGLGVHIIQTVMDSCEYSCPPGGGMQLDMVKYVSARPTATGKSGQP
jgi:serine/threonine-protein kinase RsbW